MIQNYLKAGYPALWVQTSEPHRAEIVLCAEVQELGRFPKIWDVGRGVHDPNSSSSSDGDPLSAVNYLSSFNEETILFLHNFHKFISSIEVIQAILNSLELWKSQGKCFIVISPCCDLPVELSKFFTILNFDLPSSSELEGILTFVAQSAVVDLPENIDQIISASKGLTAFEAENSFALSLVKEKYFSSQVIAEQKAQLVKKNSSLDFSTFKGKFETLAGLENLKTFAKKIIASSHSRGIMLLGIPGTGKSHFAKVLGNEVGLPTILLDMGRLFGSLVGQSEQQCREALQVVDAMSPCILFIDEIEKGLAGIASSGQTDGGTGSRVFSTFLTWLQDHESKVFVIATCNDISKIPPEFIRAERWDCIFFVDLPNKEERESIVNLYSLEYKIEERPTFSTEGWSGAEIKSLFRIASMLSSSLQEARGYVKPLSETMKDKIEGLRSWAKDRTIPASNSITTISSATAQRKVKLN
ncbi:MAG: AAA family ATPase [Nanoarchaeota archaeon]